MASDADGCQKCRQGPILSIFRCIQLDQVKSEWLRGCKVDWAITSVHACIKPMFPKAVVQAQQHEQSIGQENLPSIPYSKSEQTINPICGYSNPFRPGISSLLEEFDKIFYTIKPWGYWGGEGGGTWLTYLIVKGGPPRDWFPSTHIIPAYCICDRAKSHPHISRPVIYVLQEGDSSPWLNICQCQEHIAYSNMNPYAFNRDASYPALAGFPRNVARKDLLEAHIQVVVPEKSHGGRGDFTAELDNIFTKYRLPHITSEKVISLWHQTPMGFYQNQVNFAVWHATTGCGVSWRDHLDIDRSLARSVFRFHIYYQVRQILDELQAPLPQDQVWSPFQNPLWPPCLWADLPWVWSGFWDRPEPKRLQQQGSWDCIPVQSWVSAKGIVEPERYAVPTGQLLVSQQQLLG